MAEEKQQLVLIRHGETAWSVSGKHTGRSDIPLTANGRVMAVHVGNALRSLQFALVLVSPLQRARQTCELAGLGAQASTRADLEEWNYGDYEGLTTQEIRARRPDWSLWRDGCPGGETASQVQLRVDRVIREARAVQGDVALFAHGHILRVLTARWLDLEPAAGRLFVLSTGTVSTLSYERDQSVILQWNAATN